MKRTFVQLIDAYGDALIDAAQLNEDDPTYATAQQRAAAARDGLIRALRKAGLPVEAVAA